MSNEYLPVGIACNFKCDYCYQDPMRDAGNITVPRDWARARATLDQLGGAFTVFGGEPLLAPIEHLEEVFDYGFEKYGHNSIQTNGVLITDRHIEIFRRYRVGVGISCDGPGDLAASRCDTQTADTVVDNIRRLCESGITPSIITTICPSNVGRIKELCGFFGLLESWGVKHVNIHVLEVEEGKKSLTLEENIVAFEAIYRWSLGSKIKFLQFEDIRKLLTEDNPSTSCVWNFCDPLTTAAVQGVNPDGSRSNCGRTNKDGINWVKADKPGFERYIILHQTPQEHGGCRDCRFFFACKGQCPGTAIDGDWRNRTADCQLWFRLFELVEAEILSTARLPISRNTTQLQKMEQRLFDKWTGKLPRSGAHGDSPHGDGHGDSPHGDSHGDHTDHGAVTHIDRTDSQGRHQDAGVK